MEVLENHDEWVETYTSTWLKHFQETGETKWDIYNRPNNKQKVVGEGINLSQSRLMLISTAGGYLKGSQEPFDAENDLGDYTIRVFPSETSLDAVAYAHTHYDHTAVDEDGQVLLPLRHLEAMVEEGMIGELAPVISFMGYQPDASRVVTEMMPEIIKTAKEEDVRAALLVPA